MNRRGELHADRRTARYVQFHCLESIAVFFGALIWFHVIYFFANLGLDIVIFLLYLLCTIRIRSR